MLIILTDNQGHYYILSGPNEDGFSRKNGEFCIGEAENLLEGFAVINLHVRNKIFKKFKVDVRL